MRTATKIKIILILSAVLAIVLHIYLSVSDIMIEIGRNDFKSYTTNAVYLAMSEQKKEDFKDICLITFDADGSVSYIGVDGFKANYLSYKIALSVYEKYSEYTKRGVDIPIGAFTGLKLLSGVGKTVNVKMITVSSVKCTFETKFESVGINQTMEYLYMIVEPSVTIVTKGRTIEETESVTVICYNNLIVGKVPEFYLQNTTVASEYS